MNALITYGDSHLSLGTLIGLPVMIICALVAALLVAAFAWEVTDSEIGGLVAGVIALIVFAGAIGVGMYPFKGEYHHWQQVSGTVTSTNSRFLAKSGGADQKFVVTFDGSGQQFGCNDTRCATVRKGDDLTLTCKRTFQWFGTPGYDCNFVSMKAAS